MSHVMGVIDSVEAADALGTSAAKGANENTTIANNTPNNMFDTGGRCTDFMVILFLKIVLNGSTRDMADCYTQE